MNVFKSSSSFVLGSFRDFRGLGRGRFRGEVNLIEDEKEATS
jgi:hypothetical protein